MFSGFHWGSFLLGVGLCLAFLILLSYWLNWREANRVAKESRVVIHHRDGSVTERTRKAPVRKLRKKNGRKVGPNDVVGAGENTVAVIRPDPDAAPKA